MNDVYQLTLTSAAETCDSTQGLDTGANAAGMGALVE